MRLAAALIYLSSVAHVAAIGHGFPSTKSTSNFIDVNPAPAGGYSILNQFVKNLKLANLVAGRPTPIASASAPLPTSSASVTVADSVADSTSTGTPDSFVLPLQQLLVNSELTPELAPSPLAADVESPWNLTLPGCAKDPADHALFNAGFGNSVSLIPALADAVPQIEGASAGMPFIASPSIFTDGSCV